MLDKILPIAYITTRAELLVELQGTLNILAKATEARFGNFEPLVIFHKPFETDEAGFFVLFLVSEKTVAGFDRQIARATHKSWLKGGSPQGRKPFFVNDFGEKHHAQRTQPAHAALASLQLLNVFSATA